jgi:drug/metabolite transporter (DMT)-like permease
MNPHTAAIIQALFVVFLWATSWVFVKIGLQNIPPVTFAGLRYFLAFLCLLVVLLLNRSRGELKELSRNDWLRFILLGILLYAGTQGAVFVALAYLPAVTVNLLWSFSSVVIALLGAVMLSERPRALQWLGMLMALLGAVIYFAPVDLPQNQAFGLAVAFVGVLANAFASILGRDINRLSRHSPLVITVISMGVGSVLLLAGGIAVEPYPTLDLKSWGIVLWLALINTAFAFTLWNHTLRTLTAMESSIINGTMLVWVAIFAVIFLGETITAKEAIGLIAASLGTIIVQVRRTPQNIKTGK